jgi:hypothetical protein
MMKRIVTVLAGVCVAGVLIQAQVVDSMLAVATTAVSQHAARARLIRSGRGHRGEPPVGHHRPSLGGEVEIVSPGPGVWMEDTPQQIGKMVVGRFRGSGKRILCCHMDTVAKHGRAATV